MRKKLLFAFAVCLLLLVLLAGWLLGTQSGLNATVLLAEKLVPALQIKQAQGRLISKVELIDIRYRPADSSGAEIQQLSLDWQPSALFRSTFHIDSLKVNDVLIYSIASEEQTETEISLPEISLPLRIELASAELNAVALIDENGDKTSLFTTLKTTAEVGFNQLNIKEFTLDRNDVSANLQGNIKLMPPYQSELDYELTLKQLLEQELQLDGRLSGDIKQLKIEQTLSAPLQSRQTVVLKDILGQLQWSLDASADSIDLAAIVPEQPARFEALNLTAQGSLQSVTAQLQTEVFQPELPPLSVDASVQSDDLKQWQLVLDTAISQERTLQVTGSIDISAEAPLADLKANWQNLSWPLTGDNLLVSSPEGSLSVKGSLDQYQAQIQSVVDWQQERLTLAADTAGSMQQLEVKSLNVEGFQGKLAATGRLDWQTTPLQYQLDANWQDMVLPQSLTGRAVALKQGSIAVEGNPEKLSLSTNTDLMVDGVAAAVQAEAAGTTASGFEQSDLIIKLVDGSVQYQGPLLWAGTTLVDGKLALNKVNPGILAPEWPGSLSGQSLIKLERLAEGLQVQAQNIAISGQLRQRPVKLAGSVGYSDKLINVTQLKLQSGQSTLAANGQLIEEKVDFNWSLQSPDLQDFYPALRGELNAKGDLKGSIKQPAINADLQAGNIRFEQYKAAAVQGRARLVLTENAELKADIEASNLQLPQLNAETVQLKISGRQQQHDIELALKSKPLNLSMQASGGLSDAQIWRGQLARFDFNNDKAGQWQLTQKGELKLAADSQAVPQHCWASNNGEFCLQASHDSEQWQASGDFAQVPLSLFEAFVVELEQLQGTLRGNFKLAADKQAVIAGEGEVFLDDASLKLGQTALNQQKPVALNNVALRYRTDASKTTAMFHLEPQMDGVSAVNAELQTAGLNDLLSRPEQAALSGKITTAVKDLSVLQLSHPAFTDLKGQLDINLELAGTVSQPQIAGKASLQQGQVTIVDAGIILKQIEAKVEGDLDTVDFNLQARSGEGTLTGEGQFKTTETSWQLTTMLKARQLEVMNTPEALVIAEPDLTITVTPKTTLVKGKVHIPEAELEPTQFNTAVGPSQDVVVVSESQKPTEGGPVTEVDISVSLGDKVKLKAMGFQGRLTGDLRVFGKTRDILLGNGEIKIKDGSYLAYGQLLRVDNGSIRFAGGPVDNPELDIKAVRKGKDYKAGLHIQGYASAPQANLFSEPVMSQDNILAYILLGKPLAQASATDAALLASAASGMGLQNGAMIGDQIASTFGLDEFSIGGDSAENAALQVGKYLSPKLYLSYGIGVFESVSTVELRYELSKIWALKAESGTESGVDLLYTYERGGPE